MTSGGLVAVGDSIINGFTDSMAGVPALGWPQWLADAMDLSYTRYGLGGADSTRIVNELLPRVRGRYAVGVFDMGTNDAFVSLDVDLLEKNLRRAAEVLTAACGRVVVLTVPTSPEATDIVRAVAAAYGLIVVDADVRGTRLLKPDGIHPSALGHLEIAARAAEALGAPSPKLLAKNRGEGALGAGYWFSYAADTCKQAAKRTIRILRG
jgi:lysophospholipase L1-like esterase